MLFTILAPIVICEIINHAVLAPIISFIAVGACAAHAHSRAAKVNLPILPTDHERELSLWESFRFLPDS